MPDASFVVYTGSRRNGKSAWFCFLCGTFAEVLSFDNRNYIARLCACICGRSVLTIREKYYSFHERERRESTAVNIYTTGRYLRCKKHSVIFE